MQNQKLEGKTWYVIMIIFENHKCLECIKHYTIDYCKGFNGNSPADIPGLDQEPWPQPVPPDAGQSLPQPRWSIWSHAILWWGGNAYLLLYNETKLIFQPFIELSIAHYEWFIDDWLTKETIISQKYKIRPYIHVTFTFILFIDDL